MSASIGFVRGIGWGFGRFRPFIFRRAYVPWVHHDDWVELRRVFDNSPSVFVRKTFAVLAMEPVFGSVKHHHIIFPAMSRVRHVIVNACELRDASYEPSNLRRNGVAGPDFWVVVHACVERSLDRLPIVIYYKNKKLNNLPMAGSSVTSTHDLASSTSSFKVHILHLALPKGVPLVSASVAALLPLRPRLFFFVVVVVVAMTATTKVAFRVQVRRHRRCRRIPHLVVPHLPVGGFWCEPVAWCEPVVALNGMGVPLGPVPVTLPVTRGGVTADTGRILQDFFNRKELVKLANPEEAVAIGAGVRATMLSNKLC
ncbi:hypothetical protein OSB04_019368 [Centaurea solstitialis]|uniref:Uncharacterized protein n=1 Tax=Centaurea solstitialis TaxID=347529 RepID=A0AA38SQ66_9ASTR|nr:hypothetical protein OSB04_019368 [Centaurea solstitialis]